MSRLDDLRRLSRTLDAIGRQLDADATRLNASLADVSARIRAFHAYGLELRAGDQRLLAMMHVRLQTLERERLAVLEQQRALGERRRLNEMRRTALARMIAGHAQEARRAEEAQELAGILERVVAQASGQ